MAGVEDQLTIAAPIPRQDVAIEPPALSAWWPQTVDEALKSSTCPSALQWTRHAGGRERVTERKGDVGGGRGAAEQWIQ